MLKRSYLALARPGPPSRSFKPTPNSSGEDVGDRGAGDGKHFRDFVVTHSSKCTYLKDLCFGQLRRATSLPTIARAVPQLVSLVLDGGRPSKMGWIAATIVPPSTGMGRLMMRRRRGSMRQFTNGAVDVLRRATEMDGAVSGFASGERPDQAIIADPCQHDLMKEFLGCSMCGAATERVAMLQEACAVGAAKAQGQVRLAATFDRAYTGFGHSDLLQGSVSRTRRSASTLGGFAILKISTTQTQGA